MAWVKLDVDFAWHPKVLKAGPLGMAMQVAALCYCNKYLTDGFIPREVAPTLLNLHGLGMRMWQGELVGGGEEARWELIAEDLIEAGLWEEVEGGYRIHDYLDYQPSRAEVMAEREQKRTAGQKGGQASVKARAQAHAQANVKQVLEQNASTSQAETQAKFKPDTDTDTDKYISLFSSSSELENKDRTGLADVTNSPNNSELIAELVREYRKVIPPEKHQKGDYAFIGRLYNEFGYDTVLSAINEFGYKIESGFIPDQPLVYLKGIVKKNRASPSKIVKLPQTQIQVGNIIADPDTHAQLARHRQREMELKRAKQAEATGDHGPAP